MTGDASPHVVKAFIQRFSDKLQALAARTCKDLQVRLQVLASARASTCRRLASLPKFLACRPLFSKACRPSNGNLQRLQFVRTDSESQRQGLQVLVYKHLQNLANRTQESESQFTIRT